MPDEWAAARERVVAERKRRGWSADKAARLGEISTPWWRAFELGRQPLQDSHRQGVAKAFDWSEDWPENLPPETTSTVEHDLIRRLDELERGQAESGLRSEEVLPLLRETARGVAQLQERFDAIVHALATVIASPERRHATSEEPAELGRFLVGNLDDSDDQRP